MSSNYSKEQTWDGKSSAEQKLLLLPSYTDKVGLELGLPGET